MYKYFIADIIIGIGIFVNNFINNINIFTSKLSFVVNSDVITFKVYFKKILLYLQYDDT